MQLPSEAHARRVTRLFDESHRRLYVLMVEAQSRGATGTARYYDKQREAVSLVLAQLAVDATPAVTEAIGQAYVSGALIAERTLGINGNFAGVHREAVTVLVDNALKPLGEAIATVGRQTDDMFRELANQSVTAGVIEGSTRKQVTKAFKQNMLRSGLTAFVDKAGHRWSLDKYAAMVARTTTREAVSHGTANRMLENGHDLVTISTHEHGIDVCSEFEGKTYSLTGDTDGYPRIPMYPPFHPNCVHVMTPAAATFDEFERAALEDALTPKPPMTADPFDDAASRVRDVMSQVTNKHAASELTDADKTMLARADARIAEIEDEIVRADNKIASIKVVDNAAYTERRQWETSRNMLKNERKGLELIKADIQPKSAAEALAGDVAGLTRIGKALEDEVDALAVAKRDQMEAARKAAVAEEDELEWQMNKAHNELEKAGKAMRAHDRKAFDLTTGTPEWRAFEAKGDELEEAYKRAQQESVNAGMKWKEAHDRMHRLQDDAKNVERNVRLDLLQRVRPGYGTGEIKVRKSQVSELVKQQAQFVPREWVEQVGTVTTKFEQGGRANYKSWENKRITLGRATDGSTALHEYGHAIEDSVSAVLEAQRAFYAHRTGSEPLRKLADVYPGHGYRQNETAREDKFTSAYMGKDYGGSAYELLTMGLEGVFYGRHSLMGGGVKRLSLELRAGLENLRKTGNRSGIPYDLRVKFDPNNEKDPQALADEIEAAESFESGDREYVEWIMGLLAAV